MHFIEMICLNYNQNLLNVLLQAPVDNEASLVQIMACHQTGDKPLSEPMVDQFTDINGIWGVNTLVPGGSIIQINILGSYDTYKVTELPFHDMSLKH